MFGVLHKTVTQSYIKEIFSLLFYTVSTVNRLLPVLSVSKVHKMSISEPVLHWLNQQFSSIHFVCRFIHCQINIVKFARGLRPWSLF
jgi:hypothetical protein